MAAPSTYCALSGGAAIFRGEAAIFTGEAAIFTGEAAIFIGEANISFTRLLIVKIGWKLVAIASSRTTVLPRTTASSPGVFAMKTTRRRPSAGVTATPTTRGSPPNFATRLWTPPSLITSSSPTHTTPTPPPDPSPTLPFTSSTSADTPTPNRYSEGNPPGGWTVFGPRVTLHRQGVQWGRAVKEEWVKPQVVRVRAPGGDPPRSSRALRMCNTLSGSASPLPSEAEPT